MPQGLKRFQEAHCLHFVTFSCYHRAPLLASPDARRIFEQTLEQVRLWYGFYLTGYVVMPEPVHLLLSEPEHAKVSTGLQMLKQITAHHLMSYAPAGIFWQARYYDSTYGASARESRSYVTSIATQSNVDYARVPKFESGAAFLIILVGWKEWSKSSLSGRPEEESSLV